MSRSFHLPGPAFCPKGAAKSIIRAIAHSTSHSKTDLVSSRESEINILLPSYGILGVCSPTYQCTGTARRSHRIAGVTHGQQLATRTWRRQDPYIAYVSRHPPTVRDGLLYGQQPPAKQCKARHGPSQSSMADLPPNYRSNTRSGAPSR